MKTGLLVMTLLASLPFAGNAISADNDFMNTTEFEGSCTKATLMGEDVTGGCYGWAFRAVLRDGTNDFSFHVGKDVVMHFFGTPDPHPGKGVDTILLTKANSYQDSKLVGELPATGTCTVTGDVSKSAVIDCEAVVSSDHGTMAAVVKSTQPASFNDTFTQSSSSDGITVRFMDMLTSTCTKAVVDGADKTAGCKGVSHAGFGLKRVSFMAGVEGHLVAFSGDQVTGDGTAHYMLYVNRMYYDKDYMPATGTCTLEGDPEGKSTVVCDAAAVTIDHPYTAHAEFAVTKVKHMRSSQQSASH